jgi:hypothetical protein
MPRFTIRQFSLCCLGTVTALSLWSQEAIANTYQFNVAPIVTTQALSDIYQYGGSGPGFFPGYGGNLPINPNGTTIALISAVDGLGLLVVSKSSHSASGGAISYVITLQDWTNVSIVQLDDTPQIDNDPFSLVPIAGGFQVTRSLGYGSLYTDGELLKLEGTGSIEFVISSVYYGINEIEILRGDGSPSSIISIQQLLNGEQLQINPQTTPEASSLGGIALAAGLGLLGGFKRLPQR